ncbi:phosphoglycerate mutase family protein [Fibrobacter sp.]|uniref:phosphoglycerate mutase family protein n=1 Tax=Fibrobacter sp. TaxID=35828 RepID=UPI0038655928
MKKFGLTAIVFAALGASSLMTGCGSDGNHVTPHDDSDPNHPISLFDTLMVPSVANLPDCDESREGRAFFVQSDNLPHLCVKGSWRSAADTTDFSITCSDGFLHAVDKVPSLPNGSIVGSPDTVFIEGFVSPISGIAQKGPFVFGTSVTVTEASKEFNNETYQKAEGCILTNDGRYTFNEVHSNANCVKIRATGFYRNEVTGKVSSSPITLAAKTCSPEHANVNILTHITIPRIEQLTMNHIDFAEAKAQAEREAFAAFGIDTVQLYSQPYFTDGRTERPVAEDLDMFGNSEYSAALLAISAMIQGDRSENDMMNLANNLAEDLKGDGIWNDPNWKIKIADWVVGLDTLWKYNDIRNNVSSWGMNIPNFERYMRAFIPIAYGFGPCTDANAGQVTYVNQGQSALFANDYEHADHSRVRFICDANTKEWRIAQPIEKDTAGFGPGEYDKEVREGRVNHDSYYIFETATNAWRIATPQEADGFTDIAEVYASLKPSEKAVFIIRHSERTDDTGPKGHLTSNGKTYARDLGKRLAAVAKEDFYYGYSGYTRTQETCEEIAIGKGQADYTLNVLPYMDGAWYIKDETIADNYINAEGGWVVFSKYGFTGAYEDAFYDLETRSEELLKKNILASLPAMKRISVMCTHDYLVVPLLAYTTNGHANVRYYEKWRWVNYLSGVAMIISADGSVRYVPVKGLESGTM